MKFTELPLIDELQATIKKQGYHTPTPIQERAIPELLEGKDVLGIAQTGTGKTAAFGLPLLQLLANNQNTLQPGHAKALILAPTRELAAQIHQDLRKLGKQLSLRQAVIYGGVGQRPQEQALKKGVDILVATPGRLLDLQRQRILHLTNVEYLILDEADRMLDMGFLPDIQTIIRSIKHAKQHLLFSATMAPPIETLANKLLVNPVRIDISPETTTVDQVTQHVLYVDAAHKNPLLLHLLEQEALDHVLVFTRTKHRADRLAKLLTRKGFKADSIHGDKSQTARTKALSAFKNKKIRVLLATEIAARGLDVQDISHVINFDVPEEPDSYVHRIGRTARAGASGTAYLFCTAKEKSLLQDIERRIDKKLLVNNHKYHSVEAQESTQKYTRKSGRNQQGRNKKTFTRKKKKDTNKNTGSRSAEMKRWGKNRRDEGQPPKPKPKKKKKIVRTKNKHTMNKPRKKQY